MRRIHRNVIVVILDITMMIQVASNVHPSYKTVRGVRMIIGVHNVKIIIKCLMDNAFINAV